MSQASGHSTATRIENALSIAALAAMSVLPLLEIAARKLWSHGIPGSIPIVQHLTLWIAFLGAALAARSDRLLALSTVTLLPDRLRPRVQTLTWIFGAAVATCLLAASVQLARDLRKAGDIVALGIPLWAAVCVMPAAFAVIAGRMIWRASESWPGRFLAAAASAVPISSGFLLNLGDSKVLLPASLLILAATTLGMPIFAAIGGAAMLLFWVDGSPLSSVAFDAYQLSASPYLPAIPLFTLGGYILAEGGASRRLMRAFTALVGWVPGGLAIVTTLVLAFFTPLTGASGITIVSMGGLLLPVLVGARYPERTSLGLVTVSGSIGLLFAPSLPVILYGISSRTRIDHLFVGGLLPGILLVLVVAAWGAGRGWRAGAGRTPFRAREAASALWGSKWELLLPFLVLYGIFGGFATLVEAAALTVLYAFFVECFVFKDLRVRRDIPRIAVESAALVGGFLIILAVALSFTKYLVFAEIPQLVLSWVRSHIESRVLFLLTLNVFLLVVGALMDIYSAILIIVPLIAPMAQAYGIDPVHLGIIFLANMELGYLMPPMGENLFLSAFRFNKPLAGIYVSTLPFVLILLGAVLLITYWPGMTLGLLHWTGR